MRTESSARHVRKGRPTAQDIRAYVFSIAPQPPFGGAENDFVFGDPATPVTGIACAWAGTIEMMRQCAAEHLNLMLVHEDGFFPTDKEYRWTRGQGHPELADPANIRRVEVLAEARIVVHRFHSNLDVAPWGMPTALVQKLGWERRPRRLIGWAPIVDIGPATVAGLLDHLKRRLRVPTLRLSGDQGAKVRRIGLAWGGLGQTMFCTQILVAHGADCIVAGDVIDYVGRCGMELSVPVIDAWHHVTEMPGMEALAEMLRREFPAVPVKFMPNDFPWKVV